MQRNRCTLFATLAIAPITLGVVSHSGDSDPAGLDRPHRDVLGRWASHASCVAIDDDHVITTRHQGGGVGTVITLGGQQYRAASIANHPTADLRVVRLEDIKGNAASLEHFVSVNTGTNETGRTAVIGGFGVGQRSANTGNPFQFSYQWDGNHTRGQRWGANLVSAFGVGGIDPLTGGAFPSDVLRATFDHPAVGVAHEATISVGDSGGGWFVRDGDGWTVIGLSRAVQNSGSASHTPAELLDAVRVSSYAEWINEQIGSDESAAAPVEGLTRVANPIGWLR